MSDQSGFEIRGKVYPFAERFLWIDGPLVEQVTGMTWMEFLERAPDDDNEEGFEDPIVLLGLLAITIARANPRWKREKVIRFVSEIGMDEVKVVGPEIDEEEAMNRPPVMDAHPDGASNSGTPAAESNSDSGLKSEASSQSPSGRPASVISSQP